jgi:hypothetical protein
MSTDVGSDRRPLGSALSRLGDEVYQQVGVYFDGAKRRYDHFA